MVCTIKIDYYISVGGGKNEKYKRIKNIYFNNLDLEYINTMDGHDFEYFTKTFVFLARLIAALLKAVVNTISAIFQ